LPLDVYSANSNKEIHTEYSYTDVPDSYYNDQDDSNDDASIQREGYNHEYFEIKPVTDDVSVSLIGNHSSSDQKPLIERIVLLGKHSTGDVACLQSLLNVFPP